MDVMNKRGAALDGHKREVVACRLYASETGQPVKGLAGFEATTAGLLELSQGIKAVGIQHVAMESTGEWWKPVYTIGAATLRYWSSPFSIAKRYQGARRRLKMPNGSPQDCIMVC